MRHLLTLAALIILTVAALASIEWLLPRALGIYVENWFWVAVMFCVPQAFSAAFKWVVTRYVGTLDAKTLEGLLK